MRELLDGYEVVLLEMGQQAGPAATPATAELSVSAGPFPTTEALREFERSLAGLPGVRDVAVRGYVGADHAIVDVQLDPNT
jgi:hypothetical protein